MITFAVITDNFRRGRPDLLSSIRKSTHTEAAGKQEVDTLKKDVSSLKRDVSDISEDMEDLKANVGMLIRNQQAAALGAYSEFACNKKRKFHQETPAPIVSSSNDAAFADGTPYPAQVSSNTSVQHHIAPNPVVSTEMVSNLTADPSDLAEISLLNDIKPVPNNTGRNESIGATSLTSQDEAMLTSLIALDPLDEIEVLESPAPNHQQTPAATTTIAATTTTTTAAPVMSHNSGGV